jgi:cytochrome c
MFKRLLIVVVLAGVSTLSLAAGNIEAGERKFKWCVSCHAVGPSANDGFGPQLNGLFGRKAGSTPDYRYSAAMKGSGIVWTDVTLTGFLRNPTTVVQGTKMRFWGIGSDQDIADLLSYLRTFK